MHGGGRGVLGVQMEMIRHNNSHEINGTSYHRMKNSNYFLTNAVLEVSGSLETAGIPVTSVT